MILNNLNLKQFEFSGLKHIEISGLDILESDKIKKDISFIKGKSLFSLDKYDLIDKIKSYQIIEKFTVFKNYPHTLKIEVKKTKFLAIVKKNNIDYLIGSNGKLIELKEKNQNLPFIFGNPDPNEFLYFKKAIDESNFDFTKIKNFYYFKSKRWDIETINGNIIKLSNNNLISSLELSQQLLKDNKLKYSTLIDLRQKNQIIINE